MSSKIFEYTPLKEPISITEQNWPASTLPIVSVGVLTYNHEKFIRECIEGILMQKTTFPVRICIFEDCSTDNTRRIIEEYSTKYPKLFFTFFQEENTYGKTIRKVKMQPYKDCRGEAKYIALCEGDDYWTDSLKLKKQVDFLESNINYSGVFHNSYIVDENSIFVLEKDGTKKKHYPIISKDYTPTELANDWIIPTNSFVFKSDILNNLSIPKEILYGDIFLILTIATQGNIFGFSEIMSCYRRHEGGVSFSLDYNKSKKLLKQSLFLENRFKLKLDKRIAYEYWLVSVLALKNKKIPTFIYYQFKTLCKNFMIFKTKNFELIQSRW